MGVYSHFNLLVAYSSTTHRQKRKTTDIDSNEYKGIQESQVRYPFISHTRIPKKCIIRLEKYTSPVLSLYKLHVIINYIIYFVQTSVNYPYISCTLSLSLVPYKVHE